MSLLKYLKKALSPGGHVTAAESGIFVSAATTGNGSSQTHAHGLGVDPAEVEVYLVGTPAVTYVGCTISYTHDATNVYVTCTLNYIYRVRASA